MSERSRSNRSQQPLSLATLSFVRPSRSSIDQAAILACEGIRSSDCVGRLDRSTLAILLPDTDGAGAWKFVDRLQSRLSFEGLGVDVEVYSHNDPARGRAPHWKDSSNDDAGPPSGGLAERSANGERRTNADRHPKGEIVQREPHRPSGDHRPAEEARPAWAPRVSESPEPTGDQVAFRATTLAEIRDHGSQRPVGDLWSETCKRVSIPRRMIDVVLAGTSLVALMPLLLIVAAAVKLTSRGPVFFVQKRAGIGGRPFRFVKFRSMYIDAEARRAELESKNEKDGPIFKIKNDPRLTPLGRWLRRMSIDELPQLYNVLVGDMTFVGPRPPTLNEVEHYEPWQRDRLAVPGGLTCIWQVSGRSDIPFEEWVRMDIRYSQARSPMLDAQLVLRTFKAVATGRGAY